MKDVEFAVDDAAGKEKIFKSFEKAAAFAVGLAISTGKKVNLDVLCFSRAGAKAFGCLEEYESDPDASVTERIVISADSKGHVP